MDIERKELESISTSCDISFVRTRLKGRFRLAFWLSNMSVTVAGGELARIPLQMKNENWSCVVLALYTAHARAHWEVKPVCERNAYGSALTTFSRTHKNVRTFRPPVCPLWSGRDYFLSDIYLECTRNVRNGNSFIHQHHIPATHTLQFSQCIHSTKTNQRYFPQQKQYFFHWKMRRGATAESCNHAEQFDRK